MTVAFISHGDCEKHEISPNHPERPQRLAAIKDRMIASGVDGWLQHEQAPRATRDQLLRAHDSSYVDLIYANIPEQGRVWLDGDTAMNPYTVDAALRAAGAVVHGIDLVMAGDVNAAFCSIRPPGHHAERNRAMGFCIFDNVAVGAARALREHGLERIAIVDFDVHHGNGTEDIFRNEPRVLFCSSFQHPFYPGTGADTVSDHIINIPLPAGTGSEEYRAAVEAHWLQPLDDFRPELILFSAGFDAHAEDPLAQLELGEADYAWITAQVKRVADCHADGRIVSTLEGGYNLSALGRSVVAHIEALIGND
ncbi:MAG: histone deacetylase family protein [Acidiferrobacterales bacterium]